MNATLSTSASRETRVRRVDRHRLRDAAAEIVADDAGLVDAERIEQRDDALGMRAQGERSVRSGGSLRP